MTAESIPSVSIVIPNWNGLAFLGRCLSATMMSAQASGPSWEIIVIDDCSTDGAPMQLSKEYPNIRWEFNDINLGFDATVNKGASLAKGKYLVLLNNDLIPQEPLIGELVRPMMENENVFGVSGKTIDWDNHEPNHLNMFAAFGDNGFQLMYEDSENCCPTMFVQGGCGAFHREHFLRFGGFWNGFAPGYWEDYDISYLAMKSGLTNLYNPKAQAYHFGQGSMNRAHGSERILAVRERNRLSFLWLNLTSRKLLDKELSLLPGRIAKSLVRYSDVRKRSYIKGALQAFGLRKSIQTERQRRQAFWRISDEEIFRRFVGRGTPSA